MNLEIQPERPLVEVCVGSVADAVAAMNGGADRIELCGATELGGLTPSKGLVEQVIHAVDLPVVVMIRPRAGGFCCDKSEFRTALRDAQIAIELGVAGIVFGFLQRTGEIDLPRCREMVQLAGKHQTVFHRAFEFVPDPFRAVDQLVELRTARLLTSGQQPTALAGAAFIREIADRTHDQLEVMPGGGIRPHDVGQILRLTRCKQIHIGASEGVCDGSLRGNPAIDFVSTAFLKEGRHRVVDSDSVAAVINAMG